MTPARFFSLLLPVLLLAVTPRLDAAGTGRENVEQPLSRYTIRIGRLRSEIRSHQEAIRQSGVREVSLLDEIEALDHRISEEQEKIRALQDRLRVQEQVLAEKTRALDQVRKEEETVRSHLQTRLRAFYLMGSTGFLNVAFSRRSLPELVLFDDAFRQMLKHDQAIIDTYRATMTRLHRAMEAQQLEKSVLEDFIRQAAEEKKKLAAARRDKEELLQRIRTKKGLYTLAIKEMRKAEDDLSRTLATLRKKEKSRQRGFLLNRGMLPPPVAGRLVRAFREQDNAADKTMANGIIIDAPDNTPVLAVYPGTVLFSGYMRGFGNMIIIDHGIQYYTITARLEKRLKKEGERVDTGEVIGMAGDIATLFDPGIYFEIRHGTESLDPLQWLVPGAYGRTGTTEAAMAERATKADQGDQAGDKKRAGE